MKTKILFAVQVALVLAVATIGGMLSGDLASTALRDAHRAAATVALLVALLSAIIVFSHKMNTKVKVLALASFLSLGAAGYFGAETVGAENYDLMFNLMRLSGTVALGMSIGLLVVFVRGEQAE